MRSSIAILMSVLFIGMPAQLSAQEIDTTAQDEEFLVCYQQSVIRGIDEINAAEMCYRQVYGSETSGGGQRRGNTIPPGVPICSFSNNFCGNGEPSPTRPR